MGEIKFNIIMLFHKNAWIRLSQFDVVDFCPHANALWRSQPLIELVIISSIFIIYVLCCVHDDNVVIQFTSISLSWFCLCAWSFSVSKFNFVSLPMWSESNCVEQNGFEGESNSWASNRNKWNVHDGDEKRTSCGAKRSLCAPKHKKKNIFLFRLGRETAVQCFALRVMLRAICNSIHTRIFLCTTHIFNVVDWLFMKHSNILCSFTFFDLFFVVVVTRMKFEHIAVKWPTTMICMGFTQKIHLNRCLYRFRATPAVSRMCSSVLRAANTKRRGRRVQRHHSCTIRICIFWFWPSTMVFDAFSSFSKREWKHICCVRRTQIRACNDLSLSLSLCPSECITCYTHTCTMCAAD